MGSFYTHPQPEGGMGEIRPPRSLNYRPTPPPPNPRPRGGGAAKRLETAAVMFIPRTPDGILTEILREKEALVSKQCGYKVKIVETGGRTLADTLVKNDPMGSFLCGRDGCWNCKEVEEDEDTTTPSHRKERKRKKLPCWRRNILYKAECLRCRKNGIKATYTGESGKSIYRRALGHHSILNSFNPSSFIIRHNILCHRDGNPLSTEYEWRVIKSYQKPLQRAIEEAIAIKDCFQEAGSSKDVICMNSKTEFSNNVLPGITQEATKKEQEDDDSVRQEILKLKREHKNPTRGSFP